MTTMQKEEVLSFGEVTDRYYELLEAEREDEAIALFDRHIPILPYLAQTAKRIMGADALRASGMNLTDAFKMFGDDWLDRDVIKKRNDDDALLPRTITLWYDAREESRKTREKKREDKVLKDLIQRLENVIRNGSLQQKIDVMLYAQTLDYNYLSQDDKARGNIAGNIESLTTSLKHYEIYRDHPEQYRRFADGYRKQERVAPGREVPDDEMHKALRSHIKHIESRLSPMLPPLENAFVEAQRDLAATVRKEYIALQKSVLEMDENND